MKRPITAEYSCENTFKLALKVSTDHSAIPRAPFENHWPAQHLLKHPLPSSHLLKLSGGSHQKTIPYLQQPALRFVPVLLCLPQPLDCVDLHVLSFCLEYSAFAQIVPHRGEQRHLSESTSMSTHLCSPTLHAFPPILHHTV